MIMLLQDTVSVMSYNILLPNSVDGWWVYKMYSYRHGIPAEQTTWEVRKELLEQEIKTANCDIVCFQEVCSDSFDSDFVFMEDMGYDQHEMYKKGRFRPATFWKSSRVSVVSPPMHRDRVLVIPFRKVKKEEVERSETIPQDAKHKLIEPPSFPDLDLPFYVANCHLQVSFPMRVKCFHCNKLFFEGRRALCRTSIAANARCIGVHSQRCHQSYSGIFDFDSEDDIFL